MARKNPRLPPIIKDDIEIMPADGSCKIYYKSPNGGEFRVDDRRRRPSKTIVSGTADPFWIQASNWQKQPQYIEENTKGVHLGGEDFAKMFSMLVPTYTSYFDKLPVPSEKEIVKDFLNAAVESTFTHITKDLKKQIEKINKETKKASKGIRDSLDLSKHRD